MNELERIRDQIVRSLEGEAWHGASLLELLDGVEVEAAAARPMPQAHTIWEIVLHLSATAEAVLARLGGEARTLSLEQEWPALPAEGGAAAWAADRQRLEQVHRALIEALGELDEAGLDTSSLDEPIVPGFSSIYVTLHGLVQHSLYHAGQIALLKKAQDPPHP